MLPLGGSPHAWLLGGLGLAGLGLYLWLNWTPGVPIPSAATAPGAATTESVPGGRQTPEYARLQELANRDRAERARASGGSAMPSPATLDAVASPGASPPTTPAPAPATPPAPAPATPAPATPAPAKPDEALLRAMEAQVKELIAYRDRRFAPPPTSLVTFVDSKGQRAAQAAEQAARARAEADAAFDRSRPSNALRPGDLLHAVLQTAIDSDEPGPVRARVVGERFEGGILLGALEKLAAPVGSRPERVLVRFRWLTLPAGATYALEAYAVDPATGRTALATEVDHHYGSRWGALIAASFLEGYGEAVANQHRIVTVGPLGNVVSVPGDGIDDGQIAREALGTVGARLGDAVGQHFNRPNTIRVASGTGIGVLVVSAAAPTGEPATLPLAAPFAADRAEWARPRPAARPTPAIRAGESKTPATAPPVEPAP